MDPISQQAYAITHEILAEIQQMQPVTPASVLLTVPIGVSNRHVHLSREDMDILFGQGTRLTRVKAVKQPGQFAAAQTVTLKGPKNTLQKVRVLGPLRQETQIEISIADSFVLGLSAPIRMSGELLNSAPIEIIGPAGRIQKDHGVIVAWRHIHISPELAATYRLHDGEKVSVEVGGKRAGIMHNVIIRATHASELEMHIDVEEANAYGLSNDSWVTVIAPTVSAP